MPLRFLAGNDEVAARKLGIQKGKEVLPLADLSPNKRSRAYECPSAEPLALVALDHQENAAAGPASVAITPDPKLRAPLAMVLADPRQPSGLRVMLVEDDTENFKWGTVRFINATAKPVLVRYEKTIKAVAADWNPVDLTPGDPARNTGVQLATADDQHTIVYSAVWEHDPAVRKLAFILPGSDVRTGVVELKVIPEDRRQLPSAQPGAPPSQR